MDATKYRLGSVALYVAFLSSPFAPRLRCRRRKRSAAFLISGLTSHRVSQAGGSVVAARHASSS